MEHTYQKVLIKDNKSFSIQCIHTTYLSQKTNQESENNFVYSVYIQHTYHKVVIKHMRIVSYRVYTYDIHIKMN